MTTIQIWPTEADPDVDEVEGDCFEVVDLSYPEPCTLFIGTLEQCQSEYPDADSICTF